MKRKFSAHITSLNTEQKTLWLLAGIALLAFLFAPAVIESYFLRIVSLALIYLILTTGLNIIAGYTGQVSLGQAGLYGIGAYTGAILAAKLGMPFWICLPAAMAVAGLFGLVLGAPTLKVSGHYLALITIGFGVIVEKLLVEWQFLTGGPMGLAVPPVTFFGQTLSEQGFYYLSLVLCILTLWITNNIIRSYFGRAFSAIRDNELAASCMGINLTRYKLLAFVLSAVLAGAAGCLYAFYSAFISPDSFSFSLSIFFLLTIIVGGAGTIVGPIIGTLLLVIIPEYLHFLDKHRLTIYGALLIVSVIGLPQGIVGAIRKKFPRIINFMPPAEVFNHPIPRNNDGYTNGNILDMQNVTKRFGGLKAIDNFSMTIKSKTVHSLIGPNGAGKSTLINIINGVYHPDEGKVTFRQKDLLGQKPDRIALAGVGRTFQNVQVFRNLTVLENVMVGGHGKHRINIFTTILRSKKAREEEQKSYQQAWSLLKFMGLDDKVSEYAASLSAGQQRLLEIARALAMEPKLLLLDEPAAGLNDTEIKQLMQIIKDIKENGITVFLIEHHIDFVMDVSDTVTVVNFGSKLAEGKPNEVQSNPDVIKAYLGTEEADLC
ncbi:MAG: branched-chain amino acid ABC transporter ATP-binding protein/permease [Smithellaceae bacterium]|nr:branched-chain amino acid ABC transporter ATP-binding protein/permease [Smithellaceae bacterium]